jgi:hypothetical protein
MPTVTVLAGIYVAGAALALWRTDASWPLRIVLALLWPLGPAAFVVTVAILVAASLVAFPLVGIVAAVVAAVVWWML